MDAPATAEGATVTQPSQTGIEGRFTWAGLPVAGYRVELLAFIENEYPPAFEVRAPLMEVATRADGSFRLTGATSIDVVMRWMAPSGFQGDDGRISRRILLCGNGIHDLGDISVWRRIYDVKVNGVAIPDGYVEDPGSTVPAGEVVITWAPVELAEGYCVSVVDLTPPVVASPVCEADSASETPRLTGALVRGTSHLAVLTAGHEYIIEIDAVLTGRRIATGGRDVIPR